MVNVDCIPLSPSFEILNLLNSKSKVEGHSTCQLISLWFNVLMF